MNRRRLGVLLIGSGALLALLAGAVVFVQLSAVEALRAGQPRTWVAVAAVDIPERTLINASQVDFVAVPDEAVTTGAIRAPGLTGRSLDEATQQDLRGAIKDQFTAQRIYKGEIFNRERLGTSAGKNTPSYEIPKGKVLYMFPVKLRGGNPQNDPVLVALLNAVRAGDFVDVYYTSFELPPGLSQDDEDKARDKDRHKYLYTRRILQNLQVINVGFFPDATGKTEPPKPEDRYLTLLVTPDEAGALKWLKDVSALDGNIEIVLRSPLDRDPFPPSTVSLDSISRQFGIGTQR